MNLLDRLKTAAELIWKGSIEPFNRLLDVGGIGTGGEKLKAPYAKSVWVSSAIKHVIKPITAVDLNFSSDRRGGTQLLSDPRLTEYWEKPAIGPEGPMCLGDVIWATVGWLKLAGEAFWVFDDSLFVPFPEVRGAFPRFLIARPDRMRHVVDNGKLVGWEFVDGNGGRHVLLPEQVIHPKLWNPYNEFRGLSEYEAAAVAAEADYLAGKYKLNLAQNAGDQGVYIIAKSGIPTDEQRKHIVEQLREKRLMQQKGYFKPVFLTGDITIEDPKVRAVDEAFINSRLQDRHEIYIAFGVPPSMGEVVASYSIGSASDYYRLIRDTCVPAGATFCEAVEAVVEALLGSRVFAWFDWGQHPVMREIRRESAETATKYWDRGLPWNVLNEMLDLGMPQFDGWDISYLPFNVAPAGETQDVSSGGAALAGADTTEPAAGQDQQQASAQLRQLFIARKPARDPMEVRLWKSHMAKRMAVARMFLVRFKAQLRNAKLEMLAKLNASPIKSGAQARMTAADFIFDLSNFEKDLTVSMRAASRNALGTAGQELFGELGKSDAFAMPDPKAKEFLRGRENKMKGVAEDTWNSIKDDLQTGIDKGESISELANRMRDKFSEVEQGRAQVVAMTETSAAYGVARQEAMEQAGVQFKEWLTSGLDNVRPAHAEANGQVVKVDETFEVGGEQLDHPGDPTGSPGNVINCHCVSIAVAAPKPEETPS
jgi:SPP1 gp7 family putative phage head morphogenesis protein